MPINEYDELLSKLKVSNPDTFTPPQGAPQQSQYDSVLTQQRAEIARQGREVLRQPPVSPDARAEAVRLAQEHRMPVDFVERNLDFYKARGNPYETESDRILRESPKLAEWIAREPWKAVAAADDLAQLANQERALSFGASVLGGIDTVQSLWGRSMQWAGGTSGITRLQEYGRTVAEHNDAQREALGYRTQLFEDVDSFSGFLQWAKEGIGEQLPLMGSISASAAVGAGIGSVVPVIGTTLGAIIGAAIPSLTYGVGEVQGAMVELDPNAVGGWTPLLGGSAIAALDTVLPVKLGGRLARMFGDETAEAIARNMLAQPVKPKFLLDVTKEGAKGYAIEGVTEALQEAIGSVFAAAGSGTPLDTETMWRSMREAAATGALVGGVASTTTEAASFRQRRAQYAAALQAETFFGALAENATESKLRERLPEAYQEVVAAMTKDGPVENVFVDVDTFEKYWQSKNVNPEVMAAELTGDANALQHAKDSGTPVRIPTSAYAARIAATEHHAAFAAELRMRPDAPNVREAKEQQEAIAEQAQAMADRISAAGRAEPVETATQTPIAQAITAMLLEDTGFVEMTQAHQADALTVAQTYAAGLEAVVGNLAVKAGENPFDIIARHGITFGPAGTQMAIEAVRKAQEASTAEPALTPDAEGEVQAGEDEALPAANVEAGDATGDENGEVVSPSVPPAESEVTLEQRKAKVEKPAPAGHSLESAPAAVTNGRLVLSTRVPSSTAPRAADSTPLRTDMDAVRGSKVLASIVEAMRPYTPLTKKTTGDEQTAEAIVQQLTANLRFLWNAYPASWRERAKLWYVGAHRLAIELATKHGLSLEQSAGLLAILSPQMDWYQNVALAERVLEVSTKLQKSNGTFTPDLIAQYRNRSIAAAMETAKQIRKNNGDESAAAYLKNKRAQTRYNIKAFEGRAWSDLPLMGQAALVRMYDEVHNGRSYHVITPEGERAGIARSETTGKPTQLRWQGYATIMKALLVLRDGSVETINESVGDMHKVRSFFNNISDPWDPNSVTIDTHAIAAAYLQPMGGKETAVKNSMSGPKSDPLGIKGTNPLIAEAYFRLAEELGVLPREVQSVTWEAGRSLFPTSIKKVGTTESKAIASLWQQLKTGKLTLEALHGRLIEAAGGFRPPAWRDTPPRLALDESSLRGAAAGRTTGDLSAGPGAGGAGAGLAPGRLTQLPDGPHVPRPGIIAANLTKRNTPDGRTAVTRTLDRFRDGATRVYEEQGNRADPEVRRVGVRFEPNGEFSAGLAAAGYGTPVVIESAPTKDNAVAFRNRLASVRQRLIEKDGTGLAVYVYSAKEYQGMRLFLSEDGKAGFALKPDGDIVSVFNEAGDGRVHALIALAVQEGGTKLDCFDTVLADLYAVNGFRVVRRQPFNDEFAPEGWFDNVTQRETEVEARARAAASARAERGVRAVAATTAQRRPPASAHVSAIAEQYAAERGFRYDPVDSYIAVDHAQAAAIADVYEQLPTDDSKNPRVRKAYEAFAREVQQQWDFLLAQGYQLLPWTGTGQPYATSTEATTDIIENKRLHFFTGGEDHPFIGESTRDASGLTINDKFRAVHDVFGHAAGGFGFGERGEENAWRAHSQMFTAQARRAMTTETRGQNSWVNFGLQNYDEAGVWKNVPPADRPYAAQKVALLPDKFVFPEGRGAFADFNNGRPDVVFMEFDPAVLKTGPTITLFQTAITPNTTTAAWAYSRLQYAVEQAKTNKASGRDWKAIIRSSKAGINADEFLLAHVEDLEDGTQYTREEVLGYLRTNQVKVDTFTMTVGGPEQARVKEEADRRHQEEIDLRMNEWADDFWIDPADVNADVREVEDEETGETLFQVGDDESERYTTETEAMDASQRILDDVRDDNEREMRRQVARDIDYDNIEAVVEEELMEQFQNGPRSVKFTDYQLDEGETAERGSYREVFLTAANETRAGFASLTAEENEIVGADNAVWRSVRRNIADARMDARREALNAGGLYDQNGAAIDAAARNAALEVIEQWRNNWQELYDKRIGNGRHTPAEQADLARNIAIVTKLKDDPTLEWKTSAWKDGHTEYNHIDNPIVRLRFNVRQMGQVAETPQAIVTAEEAIATGGFGAVRADLKFAVRPEGAAANSGMWEWFFTEEQAQAELAKWPTRNVTTTRRMLFIEELQPPGEGAKVPDLYRKVWRDLGLKWALRHAAEQGLDGVSWTTGQQQADRYSLSRVVRTIHWSPIERQSDLAGMRSVRLLSHTGAMDELVVKEDGEVFSADPRLEEAEGRQLREVVGETMAARILSEATGEAGANDLRVGGEGLARLYDKDIPVALSKLPVVKKNGGRLTQLEIARETNRRDGPDVSMQPALLLTPEMRASIMAGQQTLFQEEDGERQGSITLGPGVARIQFTKSADLSTFLHETGHLYLHIMGDLVDRVGTGDPTTWTPGQKSLVSDYKKILKFLGVSERSQIGVEQHEKFARAFEAYLMMGKSPSVPMRGAFGRYRSWLVKIYKSLQTLKVDLNPEIVDVFDRLVASDDAIAQARAEGAITPVFATAEQAGMTAIEWQGYQRLVESEHQAAQNDLANRVMAELQRGRSEWWKRKTAEVRAAVEVELRNRPTYRALFWLQRNGENPIGPPTDGAERLSKDAIVERFGAARLKTLPLPWVYQVDGGLDPDAAAELFGFTSGDELLTALSTAEKFDDVAKRETDARMAAEFGNMRLDGTLRMAAKLAVEENGREALLEAELRAIAKMARVIQPINTAARRQTDAEEQSARRAMRAAIEAQAVSTAQLREQAAAVLATVPVRNLNPQLYWHAARKAGTAAAAAVDSGRYEEAVRFKSQQRLAVAMHRAALKATEDAERTAKYARRLASPAAQARLGKAGQSYQDQVNGLLHKFEFAPASDKTLARRKSLREWVEDREEEGLPITLPADVLEAMAATNYRELTVERLREVRDSLKQIDHLASLKTRLLTSLDKRTFEGRRDELVASIKASQAPRPSVLEYRRADTRRHAVREWFASHSRISTLAYWLDGNKTGGPAWELLVRPLNAAADKEAARRLKAGRSYRAVVAKHYPGKALGRWNTRVHIPAIGASLSKEGILAVALNWGNETSRQRMLSDPKRQWSAFQVQAILDTLDATDWSFVQETWDFVDSFWQEISDKQFRITGLRPEKVEALPVNTKYGQMRGGYYPLAYDSRLSSAAGRNNAISEAKLQLAGAYTAQTTRRGHIEQRRKNVEQSVRLELGVMFQHLDQVIHDLTHHEPLVDVARMLRDSKVASMILDVGGEETLDQFRSAITDIAVGVAPGQSRLDKAASWARTGAQIAALGLNLWTAAQQPLGLFNGAQKVGVKWVAKGIGRWLRDASTMENTLVWIHDVSPFMASRHVTQNQDLNDLRGRLAEPGGWFDALVRQVSAEKLTQQAVTDAFLWHIGIMQRVADVPTWLGEFEKQMAAGKDEGTAVMLADQAVRDSQGGGQTVDLAKVQRGGPLARIFMVFYTYGATTYNQTAMAVGRTQFTKPIQVARFLGDLSLLYFFPALATIVLSRMIGTGEDDDDEKTLADWGVELATEMLGIALNSMVLLREFGGLLNASNRGYGGPAGTRVIQEIYRLAGQVSQGESDEGLWKALNATAGVLLHYPSTQAQRTVEGFVALASGETADPRALLFGPEKENR